MAHQTPGTTDDKIRIERVYDAPVDRIWELWTKPEGIESWWAPDGFTVEVQKLDLKPGGELIYTMTATGPEQIEFMRGAGMPLTTESRKTFTEVKPKTRLAYSSLVDFVPDHAPYEFLTVVDLTETGGRTKCGDDGRQDARRRLDAKARRRPGKRTQQPRRSRGTPIAHAFLGSVPKNPMNSNFRVQTGCGPRAARSVSASSRCPARTRNDT